LLFQKSNISLHFHEQGELVRQLAESEAPEREVKKTVAELEAKQNVLEKKEFDLKPVEGSFDHAKMMDLLKRQNFHYDFEFTSLFHVASTGCDVRDNMLKAWKKFFIFREQRLKVGCSIFTPVPALK
jgi:hypothetical protein